MKQLEPSVTSHPVRPVNHGTVVFSLQWLRGLAAALVVLRHATAYTGDNNEASFAAGQIGVDIFFVISGVVIYLTGRRLKWHVFLRRRIARIVPIYWLFTAIVVAGYVASGREGGWRATVIPSLFFIPAHDTPRTIQPPIMPGWTLNYEMYFYIICVAVLYLMPTARRFAWIVSAAIGAGIVAGAFLVWPVGVRVQPAPLILLLPISLEFVVGIWMARTWQAGIRTPAFVSVLLVLASLIWVVGFFPSNRPYTITRPLTWGIPAAAIVWAFMSLEERVDFSRWKWPLLVGDASYATYLSHPVTLSVSFAILSRIGQMPAFFRGTVAFLACSAVGIVVHILVEKPLVRVSSRLLGLHRITAKAALHSHELAPSNPR